MAIVEEMMTSDPVCCTADDGSVECARLMESEDVGMIPVVESMETRRLIGVVTDRDFCLAIVAEGRNPADVTVGDCMSEGPVAVAPNDSLDRALDLMKENQIRRLPVIDENGACIGVIAQADIVAAAKPKEVKETLTEISRPVT